MILNGNARGGARELAVHLLREDENDHVHVHEVRGFMSEDLSEALQEADALSRGTKCQKFLFSLSLSPPDRSNVSTPQFEKAIDKAEKALGLSGQPRAIVFHEKGDHRDRHAHVVWSRVSQEMKAVPLPFNRMRMRDVSRELFIQHGWDVPRGLIDRQDRDPRNFTFEEYQQAKRRGQDIRAVKADLQNAWAISDSPAALNAALESKGYALAKGDRRSVVAVNDQGAVFSLPKMLGLKTKAVRERLGEDNGLPSLDDAHAAIGERMVGKMDAFAADLKARNAERRQTSHDQRTALVERQREERAKALAQMDARRIPETQARQARFSTGLKGVWDWLRGEHRRIKTQNEHEAEAAQRRDQEQRDALIQTQRAQRLWLADRQRQQAQRMREDFKTIQDDRARFDAMRKPPDSQPPAQTIEQTEQDFRERRRRQSRAPRRPRSPGRDPEL